MFFFFLVLAFLPAERRVDRQRRAARVRRARGDPESPARWMPRPRRRAARVWRRWRMPNRRSVPKERKKKKKKKKKKLDIVNCPPRVAVVWWLRTRSFFYYYFSVLSIFYLCSFFLRRDARGGRPAADAAAPRAAGAAVRRAGRRGARCWALCAVAHRRARRRRRRRARPRAPGGRVLSAHHGRSCIAILGFWLYARWIGVGLFFFLEKNSRSRFKKKKKKKKKKVRAPVFGQGWCLPGSVGRGHCRRGSPRAGVAWCGRYEGRAGPDGAGRDPGATG
jgi:hypothetical protein